MKMYLGDSVYADINAGRIVLTTWNGVEASNTIYLEPEVYQALVNYVGAPKNPRSSMPSVGDIIEVPWEGTVLLRAVEQVGVHPPYVDHVMVQGILHWFPIQECHIPDINNHLLVPLEEDDECPNCHNGTLELVGNDTYACRGECGAFFRGPTNQPTTSPSDDIPY